MQVKVYILNSFAKTSNGGNPAGVVLDADKLSDKEMQKISKNAGFSETAFVRKFRKSGFGTRFFTPKEEVNLCGHATVAAFYLLFEKGIIKKGKYNQETKAGLLHVDVRKDAIYMEQNSPEFFEEVEKEEIAECLGLNGGDFHSKLPAQIVSTGSQDIMVPVKSLETLLSIKLDFGKIAKFSKNYNVNGMNVFTLETKFNSTAHCRNFAPLIGISEESATGITAGALSCYLYRHGMSKSRNMVFEQGYVMNKPSEIFTKIKIKQNKVVEVWVGGKAINSGEIEVSI